jgi:enoyl-CoA hydratase/carnithine racemase
LDFKDIRFTVNGPIGILTLARPEKVNALSRNMIAEISSLLPEVAADASVRVLIVRADGKHFCAGHDLSEMTGVSAAQGQSLFDACGKMMAMLHDLPQPVIAQVQGVATAAGCQLVAWCDLAVADTGARFATPGVRIGLFCTTPMVAITRAIGRKAAMEMLLTGRFFSAEEARALGLVNRVVPAEALASTTEAMAGQIAEASRHVLAMGKRAFYDQIDQPDQKAMAYAGRTIALNLMTEDAQHGIRAFMEKTPPEWKNR